MTEVETAFVAVTVEIALLVALVLGLTCCDRKKDS